MGKVPLFHPENISALEKFLQKNVLEGAPGAAEIRDYMRAKGRADIVRRIATAVPPGGVSPTATNFPGELSQKIMEGADDARYAASLPVLDEAVPDKAFSFANGLWQRLRDSKFRPGD